MHLNSYEAKQFYKRKLRKLLNEAVSYPQPVFNKGSYIERVWRGSHQGNRYKRNKKISSKMTRRKINSVPYKGCGYKRVYDYFWECD